MEIGLVVEQIEQDCSSIGNRLTQASEDTESVLEHISQLHFERYLFVFVSDNEF